MPKTPHDQIASAGFSPADTEMLLGVFDTVYAGYSRNPAVAQIISESLTTMASLGTRAPAKLAAYAEHRARFAALNPLNASSD